MSKSIEDVQRETGEWAERTFPSSNIDSVLDHMIEEVLELNGIDDKELVDKIIQVVRNNRNTIERREYGEEGADVVLLVMHLEHKTGNSLERWLESKLKRNRERTWNTKPTAGTHTKHDESEGATWDE